MIQERSDPRSPREQAGGGRKGRKEMRRTGKEA